MANNADDLVTTILEHALDEAVGHEERAYFILKDLVAKDQALMNALAEPMLLSDTTRGALRKVDAHPDSHRKPLETIAVNRRVHLQRSADQHAALTRYAQTLQRSPPLPVALRATRKRTSA